MRSLSAFEERNRCRSVTEGEFIADVKPLHMIAAEAEIYTSFIEARCPAGVTYKAMTGCTRAHTRSCVRSNKFFKLNPVEASRLCSP